ncbi:MAG: DUF2007 domain-containing protein [Sedimentisphaerales bacterium]|nr:DUF2007 domain-containing protein [Sedimentisphaerales bacterium]
MDEYVEVYIASDITFAYLVKAQLEDAGIPVQIANENVSAAYCIDGMVPRVLVPASHAEQARELIAEMRQRSPADTDELDGLLDEDDELDDADVEP